MKTKKMLLNGLWLFALSASAQDSVSIQSIYEKTRMYAYGTNQLKDDVKAFTLFSELAATGDGKSLNAKAIMFKNGNGIARNRDSALYYFTQAGKAGYAKGWYNIAMLYKDGDSALGISQDFGRAYEALRQAAALGDDQSTFAVGYMRYKGLGCNQDYTSAVTYFRLGAAKCMTNSMYFLGLSLRNGYGVHISEDSARYWLQRAANLGDRQASKELNASLPENSNVDARALAARIRNITGSKDGNYFNVYRKVENNLSLRNVDGTYKGYVLHYDWSGQQVVGSSPLTVTFRHDGDSIIGTWMETSAGDTVPLKAQWHQDGIRFYGTSYIRTDHYSRKGGLPYRFETAQLHIAKEGDSVYLSGNLQLYSTQRKEPQKPVAIVLSRARTASDERLLTVNGSSSITDIVVFPNPFKTELALSFTLSVQGSVTAQIFDLAGKLMYTNKSGTLEIGKYQLRLQPKDINVPGVYILKLTTGVQTASIKIIKQ